MVRLARYDVPDIPHHVIQRGNNRSVTFVADEDCVSYYLECLEDAATRLTASPQHDADGQGRRSAMACKWILTPFFWTPFFCRTFTSLSGEHVSIAETASGFATISTGGATYYANGVSEWRLAV